MAKNVEWSGKQNYKQQLHDSLGIAFILGGVE